VACGPAFAATYYVDAQRLNFIVGGVGMLVGTLINPSLYRRLAWPLAGVTVALLCLVLVAGEEVRATVYNGWGPDQISTWAIHAGGRSILDAAEKGLELPQGSLWASRDVLARYGNMSSSTLMFVLSELIGRPDTGKGVAIAFGPGLAKKNKFRGNGGRKKERCSILQQTTGSDVHHNYTTIEQYSQISDGFYRMYGGLDGCDTTSGIINADQTKRGQVKRKTCVWQGQMESRCADVRRRGDNYVGKMGARVFDLIVRR